jgi:hypothetical protein
LLTPQASEAATKIGDGRSNIHAGGRKQITVLCANCKATFEAIAECDPEEALTIFEDVLGLMTEAIGRYEGTINLTTASGVVALLECRGHRRTTQSGRASRHYEYSRQ